MAKIVINIDMEELQGGVNQMVDDDFNEEFTCPLVTEDKEENSANRQYAIDEFAYGTSSKNWEKKPEKCGICKYYDIRSEMIGCIEDGMGDADGVGYCMKFDFVCSGDNVCNAYEAGGPVTDYKHEDKSPIKGGSKDIF
tara:strand:- start:1375 stop:1791 length:417 start_codon:yes stop_codon:yes gene_type:complete